MMSIYTCGELGQTDPERLKRKFGIIGPRLRDMGLGIDNSPVVDFSDDDEAVKSVGHSRTLDKDISDQVVIRRFLLQLSEMVGSRARKYGVSGKTVSLYVRYADFFSSWGKQTTLRGSTPETAKYFKSVKSSRKRSFLIRYIENGYQISIDRENIFSKSNIETSKLNC